METIIQYLIEWLCYGNTEAAARVAYTADESALQTHDLIIVPNGHLGKDIVLPDMGKPVTDNPEKGKYIIRTDILYNAFFFTSRAEELINDQRDEHGRFAARFSILGKGNRLQIPMLDEHARLVLKLLDLPMPEPGFGHVYLTHDIDSIAQYRHLRGAIGGILRGETKQVLKALRSIHNDPLYTFPWLLEQDAQVPNADTIYFVKRTKGKGFDYPQYCLRGRDYRRLNHMLRHNNAYIGVHGSYYGSIPKIEYSRMFRAHYLRSSIEHLQRLADAGYTDDFTMGFADSAGFRLQTTRPVRWINPQTYELTPLTLHPLTVMDCTLSNDNYMHLTEDEAYFFCERLISKIRMHHGDPCLLWHNSIINNETYHKSLYPQILSYIAKK
ncbi:MAG: hypothetical protein IKS01_03025 [Paludibacteraceae bacterium]|nr:hypothetical protein [Paludibacteraceae bacterium]